MLVLIDPLGRPSRPQAPFSKRKARQPDRGKACNARRVGGIKLQKSCYLGALASLHHGLRVEGERSTRPEEIHTKENLQNLFICVLLFI